MARYGLPMLQRAGLFRSVQGEPEPRYHRESLLKRPHVQSEEPTQDQSQEPQQDYSYGVEKPSMPDAPKEKWWQTLLNIALPAVVSASEGNGLIPGAAVGYMMDQGNRQALKRSALDTYEDRMKDYQNERKFRQTDELGRIDRGLRKDQFEETQSHNRAMEGIGRMNAGANQTRAASNQPDLSGKSAYENLSPEEVNDLTASSPDQLEKLMAHPDTQVRQAASYLYNLRTKSKQLPKPDGQ